MEQKCIPPLKSDMLTQVAAVPEGESKAEAQAEATNRFNEINLELSNLSTNFSNNLLDSTAAFKRLITDKAGVAGLPASFLGQAAQKVRSIPFQSPFLAKAI